MNARELPRNEYTRRLEGVIPGGAHTYSRGSDQFPSNAPAILARGQGAHIWDPEGNKFLDYGMSLRAVTLGYANRRVNAAAIKQIEFGNNLTRASLIELEAAELLVDLIPYADMVKFAKNGSNATTAAVKLARAFTGRDYVCVPREQPFFSFDDWFIGATEIQRGIPELMLSHTLYFDYGDEQSLQALFAQYPGQIAGVLLEPATTLVPCETKCSRELSAESGCNSCLHHSGNFLKLVQEICQHEGALFILDEMITGFRWHLQGAATYFGVTPDLATFGKGMANGFSVAAVCGRREVMDLGSITPAGLERTFLLSSTHGGEMSSLGAFVETVAIYKEEDVIDHLWQYGKELRDGLVSVAASADASNIFLVSGPPVGLSYAFTDSPLASSLELRTLFAQEMVSRGILMPWISVSFSHNEDTLKKTLDAAFEALITCAKAAEVGPEGFLNGPTLKPVFRKYN